MKNAPKEAPLADIRMRKQERLALLSRVAFTQKHHANNIAATLYTPCLPADLSSLSGRRAGFLRIRHRTRHHRHHTNQFSP